MPYAVKPKVEQHRASLPRRMQPMRERDIVPLQAALVAALADFPDLIVEKTRRLPRDEAMIDISAKWLGLDADPDDVIRALRDGFPEGTLQLEDPMFWVGPDDERVLLFFAGQKEGRFLTGRLLITFA